MLVVIVPVLFFTFAAFALALHHYYVHSRDPTDKAQFESCAICCYLQPSDMANHEIWVVCLYCIAITWAVAGKVFGAY
jgi:hypothetical protein